MSLIDTIKGARQEIEEAGSLPSVPQPGRKSDEGAESTDKESTGFSRKSVTRAKPTRELAGSVRSSAKPNSQKSKEERKAERDVRRSEDDLRHDVAESMLRDQPKYNLYQKIWWACLGFGLAFSIIAWFLMRTVQGDANGANAHTMAVASIVLMVLAYVLIIGAFIFDLVKVRPLRNQASDAVKGISVKRLRRMTRESEQAGKK